MRKARRTRWDLPGDPVAKPLWLLNHTVQSHRSKVVLRAAVLSWWIGRASRSLYDQEECVGCKDARRKDCCKVVDSEQGSRAPTRCDASALWS